MCRILTFAPPKQHLMKLTTRVVKRLADLETPVSIYSKLRQHFRNAVLLESNDAEAPVNNRSIVGLEPMAQFRVQNGKLFVQSVETDGKERDLTENDDVPALLWDFMQSMDRELAPNYEGFNGLIGHTSFDGVQYFDTLKFDADKRKFDLPDLNYSLYRFVITVDHHKQEMYFLENLPEGEESQLSRLDYLLKATPLHPQGFEQRGERRSNLTDAQFREMVETCKHHCRIGDVFQIVPSRQFQQDFAGDEFAVYRVLRLVNPSPYLFFFDCGDYKIFGSSPEAQMVVRRGVATVNPIAGTYKRTGDPDEDRKQAEALLEDPKENAEHIMLVDLARNDLGRHCTNVRVERLKEVQYFSHVIHLVSRVSGDLPAGTNPVRIFGDTFPAGTLSGAPKYKALELLNGMENQNRAFYGGGLGIIDFNGDMNQAIVIRSFMSYQHTLYSQAGAGVVVSSDAEKELQEVNNKLGALNRALELAEEIGNNS